MAATSLEEANRTIAENDRTHREAERQARQVQEKQQVSNNQADWDRYVDARIAQYLNSHYAEAPTDVLPDALHEALGQVLAEERRQWRRERELIQSEAQRVIADLRATIADLAGEIRQKAAELRPGIAGPPGQPGPPGPPGRLPLAKAWEPSQVFYSGDVVVHRRATYQCLRDNGRSVTHADD